MNTNTNDLSFIVNDSVFGIMSMFGRSLNAKVYMSCFQYIADQIKQEASRTIPYDGLRTGLADYLRRFDPDKVYMDIGDDLPALDDEDVSNPETKRYASAYRILSLFETRGLIRATAESDDLGNIVTYIHMRSLGLEFIEFLKRASSIDHPSFKEYIFKPDKEKG